MLARLPCDKTERTFGINHIAGTGFACRQASVRWTDEPSRAAHNLPAGRKSKEAVNLAFYRLSTTYDGYTHHWAWRVGFV